MTNLPSRPAPLLAHTVTSLAAVSGGRVILGLGSGGLWDFIVKLGVGRLTPGEAVAAMAEAIQLIRALSGSGDPVTIRGKFYKVSDLEPSPVPAPPVWAGAVGPAPLLYRTARRRLRAQPGGWLAQPALPRIAAGRRRGGGGGGTRSRRRGEILNFAGRITPSLPAESRQGDGRWQGGSAERWVEELTGAVLEHGPGGFVYREPGSPPSEMALRLWSEEVVPAVRQRLAGA